MRDIVSDEIARVQTIIIMTVTRKSGFDQSLGIQMKSCVSHLKALPDLTTRERAWEGCWLPDTECHYK